MDSTGIRELVLGMGADLCGIAPADRFDGAPEGFRPGDIWPACRSVLVFAMRVPACSTDAASCIPYTFVSAKVNEEIDLLTVALSRRLEGLGIANVPLPSDDPSEYWEPDREYARGVLSLRHAGHLAGLGVIGRNTLLVNGWFGNMIQLGAILLDREFEGDPVADYRLGCEQCGLCVSSCPRQALDGPSVDQQACRPVSNFRNQRGFVLKKCWTCRRICPHSRGVAGL